VKFRRKPIVLEAEQFFPSRKPWPDGVYRIGGSHGVEDETDKDTWCRVKTLEGELRVATGDWIVTGVNGEKWPVKPDVFEATYEPAEDKP
jgi:hypothetical protein